MLAVKQYIGAVVARMRSFPGAAEGDGCWAAAEERRRSQQRMARVSEDTGLFSLTADLQINADFFGEGVYPQMEFGGAGEWWEVITEIENRFALSI
jgi:hypothetical protein